MTTPAVTALWAAAWGRLAAEHPDLDGRLASVEHVPAVARALAAAGREAGRCQRGAGDLAELERRLSTWQASVLKALAARDQVRSVRLCIDCGDSDTPTIQPGLTGGRVCARCTREATPITTPRGGRSARSSSEPKGQEAR
jgi:hypothetical protein